VRSLGWVVAGASLVWGAACGVIDAPTPDAAILIVPASYHEAMNSGGHQRHVGVLGADGGRIECRSCHDLDRDGFASPQVRPCKTCHEPQAGFHHGPSDGGALLPDGGTLSCLNCHRFTATATSVSAPVTPWACLECHAQPIGQVVAVKAHDAACFYCHAPHQEPFTQPTECTVCHEVTNAHGAKAKTVVESCMQCHERHAPAIEATKHCVACHADPKEQPRRATFVTQQSLFKGHPSCGSCHVPHRFLKRDVKPCVACHDSQVSLARASLSKVKNNPKKASGHARCTDCHDAHGGAGASPKRCESCHQDVLNNHPSPKGAPSQVCTQCHPMHQALPGVQVAKDCGECHDDGALTGLVHGKDKKTGASLTCRQCHPPHAFAKRAADRSSCKECHQATMAATAKMKKAGHAKCEDCHQGLPHKPSFGAKAGLGKTPFCLSCHETLKPPQEGHQECEKCHETHSGAKLKGCLDCHKLAELPGLHVVVEHQKCEGCHAPHGSQPFRARVSCLSGCHDKEIEHEPQAERCYACHLFRPPKPGDTAVDLKKKK